MQQAREVAQPIRRSAAGQIQYPATLGRVAKHSGLTVQEAPLAIERHEAAPTATLKTVKQRMLASNAKGLLQIHIRRIFADNCQKAELRKAAWVLPSPSWLVGWAKWRRQINALQGNERQRWR